MLYSVLDINGHLHATSFEGSFYGKDDEAFLLLLARKLGYSKIDINRKTLHTQANKQKVFFEGVLDVVPYVYISGKVEETSHLNVPFVNGKVFNEYLVAVDRCPGLRIPINYLQYLPEDDSIVGTEFTHPVATYNGIVVTTLPFFLPASMNSEGTVLYKHAIGLPGYYPLSIPLKKFEKFLNRNKVMRFITDKVTAFDLGMPCYPLSATDSVVFYLPNMVKSGSIFLIHEDPIDDPRGIGVDTEKEKILTCMG